MAGSTNTNAGKRLFSTGQVAKICGVAPRTVSKWFDSGKIKGYRIPGSNDRRVTRSNLLLFMREHNLPGTDELEEADWVKIQCICTTPELNAQLGDYLREADDYRFRHSDNTFDAGIQLATSLPDVVVLDFVIGRSVALSVAKTIVERRQFKRPRLIGLVAEDDTNINGLYSIHGFNAVFQKPVDVTALVEKMRRGEV